MDRYKLHRQTDGGVNESKDDGNDSGDESEDENDDVGELAILPPNTRRPTGRPKKGDSDILGKRLQI